MLLSFHRNTPGLLETKALLSPFPNSLRSGPSASTSFIPCPDESSTRLLRVQGSQPQTLSQTSGRDCLLA